MMKKVVILLVLLSLTLICPHRCYAYYSTEGYSEILDEQLTSALGEENIQRMYNDGIDLLDISVLSPVEFFRSFIETLKEKISFPAVIFVKVSTILLLSSLVRSFSPDGGMSSVFESVCSIACVTVIFDSVLTSFDSVGTFLKELENIMRSYIPIFASVTAASGGFRTGGSYYACTLGICELISFSAEYFVMPFLRAFLALSLTAAVNPDMNFSDAASSIKGGVKLLLTSLMTVFTGMNAIKCLSSSSLDTAASRAVRFGASSFVPIIGSSVSEGYSAVYSSIGILKTGVGNVGIMVILFILLKPMAELILVRLVLLVLKIISDMLGIKKSAEFLGSTGYAVSAALSTVLCFSMMFVISTAVVMMSAV